eukprot:g588.t1
MYRVRAHTRYRDHATGSDDAHMAFDGSLPCDFLLQQGSTFVCVVVVRREEDYARVVQPAEAFLESLECVGRFVVFLTDLKDKREFERIALMVREKIRFENTLVLPVAEYEVLGTVARIRRTRANALSATFIEQRDAMKAALLTIEGIGEKAAAKLLDENISLRDIGKRFESDSQWEGCTLSRKAEESLRELLTTPLARSAVAQE